LPWDVFCCPSNDDRRNTLGNLKEEDIPTDFEKGKGG